MANNRVRKNRFKNSQKERANQILSSVTFIFKSIISICGLCLLSLFFVLCYDFITQSHHFAVKDIYVEHGKMIPKQIVLKLSEVKLETNIFSINIGLVEKKLLNNPWISDVKITREIPSSIYIATKEYEPLAIIDLGRKYLIDIYGNIFKEWETADPKDLPVILGLSYADIKAGNKQASVSFEAVMEILKICQKGPNILSTQMIKKINIDKDIGITIYAFEPTKTISLGYSNLLTKYDRLEQVVNFLKQIDKFEKVNFIDLKNYNRVVISPNPFELSTKAHKEV
ncbi:MAG: FtsQ-type POTRA domain-containing protein [Desulfobacterales bacterium]|nr:FtsQ-type POTRA domain-containing protein [Desulfobacterales bacterium]MBF0396054.1 FtsQ-type POTRA domain-containing protein [Desulfobacterales bacterium]